MVELTEASDIADLLKDTVNVCKKKRTLRIELISADVLIIGIKPGGELRVTHYTAEEVNAQSQI